MTEGRPSGSRFSSRTEPYWLNPASTKGAISILVGLLILFAPNVSAFLVRVLGGIGLVVSGIATLWFAIRYGDRIRGWRTIAEAVVAILFGVMLLVVPSATLKALALIGGIYLAVRGVTILISAYRARRGGESWGPDLIRGLLYFSLAAVLYLVPEGIAEGMIVIGATASVIVGAIMLVFGIRDRTDSTINLDVASVSELINGWLQERDVGDTRRDRIGDGFFFEEPDRGAKLASWWMMLLLSVAIATFGVIQDSTAVVIGAMLIAPLMTPILGTSAGIVNVWKGRVVASAVLVLAGAGAAVGLAFIIGQWVPIIVPLEQNSQVISRVTPNLIDMLIALVAGAAGAYANVDDRVSDSIAGVAIAVALVPPLGVVGLTLQAGMFEDAFGALLLFLTNLVSIILAAALVFFLTGYAPYRRIKESREEIAVFLRAVALAAILIVIPLSLTADDILAGTARQAIANEAVADWIEGSDLEVIRVTTSGDEVNIFLTGPGDVPTLATLETSLTSGFGFPVALRVEHAPTTVITTQVSG